MTRMSKKEERRHRCPKKNKAPSVKTGSLKDNLSLGYKVRENTIDGELGKKVFISKIK